MFFFLLLYGFDPHSTGKFQMIQLASKLPQSLRSFMEDHKRSIKLDDLLAMLDGIKAHPWMKECIELLELASMNRFQNMTPSQRAEYDKQKKVRITVCVVCFYCFQCSCC